MPAHVCVFSKLDKPTLDDWINSAAFVASHDQELFIKVMDKAKALASTFDNSAPQQPNPDPTSAPLPTADNPQIVKFSDDLHMLIVWHAAKRIQALVYDITNELDPSRRRVIPVDRFTERAHDIVRWANALETYCEADDLQIHTMTKGKK